MRHRVAGKKLGRNTKWRAATIRDIAKATLLRQRICTTKVRAKEARKLIDRMITLGKKGTLAHKRRAFAVLCDHQLVSDLFNKIAPRFLQRNGGYTRIIPLGLRPGDNAHMVFLELTEKDMTVISKPKTSAAAKTKQIEVKGEPVKKDAPEKPAAKAAPEKVPGKKEKVLPVKEKTDKNIVGGLKKIFGKKNP